jgi:hypothetical protein
MLKRDNIEPGRLVDEHHFVASGGTGMSNSGGGTVYASPIDQKIVKPDQEQAR